MPPAAPNSPLTPPKLEIRRALAPIQFTLGKFDEAGDTAAEVLKEDPADLNSAIIRYKDLFEHKHDAEAARAVLEDALLHAPAGSPGGPRSPAEAVELALAFQYLEPNRSEPANLHQAAIAYDRVLAGDPNNSEALNGKGIIAMRRKLYLQAIEQFKRAVAADPNNAAAYNNLGEAYEHLPGDHFAEALDSYRHASRINPGIAVARMNLARYAKYAKFGWEPREQLPPNRAIPVYHSGRPAAPSRRSKRHRHQR
jgi:tetratricopeptide (TPR) repeat protein